MRRPTIGALLLLAVLCSSGCPDPSGPWIEALLPASAPSGAVVDVVGERFAGTSRIVAFGGRAATVQSVDDRRARVIVPVGLAGSVPVVVTVDGRPSNDVSFYVQGTADGGP